MARMPRLIVPGQAHHVVQRGNDRQATFFADDDYLKYLDALRHAAEQSACIVHAYVLMTNHIHLLATPSCEGGLSLMMQAIGRKYVRYVNDVYGRRGTLWEGRFRSALIDSERYLLTCSRYIELNPVRAGLVKGPGQYRWSSYRANALGQADACVTPHPLYQGLGASVRARCEAYRALFSANLPDDALTMIRKHTDQCTVVGDDRFRQQISSMLKRRVVKLEHGGDRKGKKYQKRSRGLTP